MKGDVLGDVCLFQGLFEDLVNGDGSYGLIRVLSGEKRESLGAGLLPVVSQQHQQALAEHDVSVLAALSGPDMNEHAVGVDISPSAESTCFGDPQACRIGGSYNRSVFDGLDCIDDRCNLFLGQDVGQSLRYLRIRDSFDLSGSIESDPVEEFDPGHEHLAQRWRCLALFNEMQQELSDLRLPHQVRRSVEMLHKAQHATGVRLECLGAVVSQEKI